MTDVLTAIDDALETGVAADDDPLTRELQELALALRADAPQPTPVYREWLDKQVETGFPKRRRSKPPWWRKLLQPAAGVGLVAAFVLVIAVAGGGLSGSSSDDDGGGGGGGSVALESGDDGGSSGGGAGAGGGAEPAVVEPQQDAAKAQTLERSSGSQAADDGAPGVPLPPGGEFAPGRRDRKIERAISLELEMPLDEMARVAEQVTTVTNRHGGFVLSSSVSTGDEDSSNGEFSLRIPSDRLRPAVRDLSALADVRTQSQSGRDVTREHVTARDRLQAARAERRSLLRRLEVAVTDEEAEALRRQLDIVAGEINGLRGQLRNLRLRTDYAVVTVTLFAKDGEDGGGGGAGSFDDAIGDAGDLLVAVAGVLVRALAVALPIGLLVLAGWLVGRVVTRRRRESALA